MNFLTTRQRQVVLLGLTLMSSWQGKGSSAQIDNRVANRKVKATKTSLQKYLDTTFDAKNGSYGNMFDVRARRKVQVEGFDFHIDKFIDVNYEIFTTPGSYLASKHNPDDWSRIASGTVRAKGRGVPTPIPEETISPVTIEQDGLQAFYVTLDTFDIRYSYGTEVGQVYASNDDIEILEGSGVVEYPFGETFYSPRIWNGGIRYTDFSTPTPTSPPTENLVNTVTFSFFIQQSIDVSLKNTEALINSGVRDVLMKILWDGTKNSKILSDSQFYLIDVKSILKDLADNDPQCNVIADTVKCSIVDIDVTFSHDTSVLKEEARSSLLVYKEEISVALDFLRFVAKQQISSDTMISLSGTDFKEFEDEGDQDFFEETVMSFLNQDFSTSTPLKITFVKILSQNILIHSSRRYLTDGNLDHLESSLNIQTMITGEYNPPPDINLDLLVEDSFDNNGDLFVQALKKNDHFKNIQSVETHNAKRKIDVLSTESAVVKKIEEEPMSLTTLMIAVTVTCTLVFLSVVGTIFYFSVRDGGLASLVPKSIKICLSQKGKNTVDDIRQADVSATFQELGSTRRGSITNKGSTKCLSNLISAR